MDEALITIRNQQAQAAAQRMQNNRESLFSGLYEQYNIPYHTDGDARHRADFFSLAPHQFLPVILEIHGVIFFKRRQFRRPPGSLDRAFAKFRRNALLFSLACTPVGNSGHDIILPPP